MRRTLVILGTIIPLVFLFPLNALAFNNFTLIEIAKKYEGEDIGLQCKGFVQKVVLEAGGKLGIGYRFAYLDAGREVSPKDAETGDIIQLDIEKNHLKNYDFNGKNGQNYTSPMHTAIVIENLGNGNYKVIDSNYYSKKMPRVVKIHDWNPFEFAKNKLHVHFYRLGTVSSEDQKEDNENQTEDNKEDDSTNNPVTSDPIATTPYKWVSVALGIDDSESMMDNDPTNFRRSAAKFFIDLMSPWDKLAVYSFGENANVLRSMSEIYSDKQLIKDSVQLSSSQSFTNMDVALNTGYLELEKDKSNYPKYLVLLTDGRHLISEKDKYSPVTYKKSHLKLWQNNWMINGIMINGGFSILSSEERRPDEKFLQSIVGESEGHGKYYSSINLRDLEKIYLDISSKVQAQRKIFSQEFMLRQGENKEFIFEVPDKALDLQIVTTWPGSKVETLILENNLNIIENTTSDTYQIIRVSGVSGKKIKIKTSGIELDDKGELVSLSVHARVDVLSPSVKIINPNYSDKLDIKLESRDNIGISTESLYVHVNNKWIPFSTDLRVKDGLYLVKAVVTDEQNNKTIAYSQITTDTKKPSINVIKRNSSFFKQGYLKVFIDERNLKIFDINSQNGKKITIHNSDYILHSPKNGNVKIVAIDRAGNKANKSISVNENFLTKSLETLLDVYRHIKLLVSK